MNARKSKRQGALTVGKWACSSVLERSEGGVGLECLRDVLGALCTELVVTQTAIESKTQTSGGADSRKMMRGSVLELGEGLVRLKTLGKVLGALCTNAVILQTANGSQNQTSGG